MPFADVNGIRLHYQTYGTGESVIFAHGRGGNHLSWWQQVPYFSRKYRCIVIDHREYGLSADRPGGPGRKAHVDDLRALLDHLGVERTHLVGQSMGGNTCMGFALAHPERVLTLVLADTGASIAEPNMLADFAQRAPKLPQNASVRAISLRFRETEPAKAFLYAAIGGIASPARESFVDFLTDSGGHPRRNYATLVCQHWSSLAPKIS